LEIKDGKLKINRLLSELDKKVLEFTRELKKRGLEYVIVSGYVAILTGRSRGTEDIDLIIEELSEEKTKEFAQELMDAGYRCINSEIGKIYEMLEKDLAVRFAEKDTVIPNFKVRFPSDNFEKTALKESLKAELNSDEIPISPIELQIAYKLYLSSEKDLEDALHLYKLFEGDINEKKT